MLFSDTLMPVKFVHMCQNKQIFGMKYTEGFSFCGCSLLLEFHILLILIFEVQHDLTIARKM